jgi:hypothetical protein
VFWLLLVVIAVVGGVAMIGIAASGRRQLPPGARLALPSGDKQLERTIREVRVDDVVSLDGRDFLCEGTIGYDEDGHRWLGARCVDGGDERWIVSGIERLGAGTLRVMTQDDATPITGYPPEAIVVGDVRYALDKRGTATCTLRGELGGLGAEKRARADGAVERCRWWLYAAPGEDTLLVEQWGSDFRVLRGKKVGEGTIDLIPAS